MLWKLINLFTVEKHDNQINVRRSILVWKSIAKKQLWDNVAPWTQTQPNQMERVVTYNMAVLSYYHLGERQ